MTAYNNPITGDPIGQPPFSIPEILGNVVSYTDQIIKIIQWVNKTLDNYATDADLNTTFNDLITKINELTTNINAQIDALKERIEELDEGQQLAYNPTKGEYQDTKRTNRDLYRELAVFGARVDQIATLTVAQAAEHKAIELPLIGNYSIFGNKDPHVTPIEDKS